MKILFFISLMAIAFALMRVEGQNKMMNVSESSSQSDIAINEELEQSNNNEESFFVKSVETSLCRVQQ